MKPTDEWDENYILNLPLGEHDWVEFKGSMSLDFSLPKVDRNDVANELSKQISAFSNSGGGNIIYGIKDSNLVPREIDNGGISLNLGGKSTKEWLEDIIPNLVEFPLSSFNVYVIVNKGKSQISEGKGIYLISISDSDLAPHQAKDQKYYARVGGKSRPISHRFVMDIIGRSKHPMMKPEFSFEHDEEDDEVFLKVFIYNSGKVYANYVNGFIYVPKNIRSSKDDNIKMIEGKEYSKIYISNIHKDLINYKSGIPALPGLHSGVPSTPYYITRYDPVLPNLGFTHRIDLDSELNFDELKPYKDIKIYWDIYTDNAGVRSGDICIGDIIKHLGV